MKVMVFKLAGFLVIEEPSKQIPHGNRKVIYTNKDDTSGFEIRTKYVPKPRPQRRCSRVGLGNLKTYLYTNSDLLDATVDVNGARSIRVVLVRKSKFETMELCVCSRSEIPGRFRGDPFISC